MGFSLKGSVRCDEVEFFMALALPNRQKIEVLWDEEDAPIERAPHAMMIVKTKVDTPVKPFDMMRSY